MTKEEAYAKMEDGLKIRHHYYSKEEFTFINGNGKIETEDGCIHGIKGDEFWSHYQRWEDGWEIYDD